MVFSLIIWRADVVRAMPQTAAFFKMTGMGVNLRGLAFEDLKISTELVNNKPVLLIEGAIVDITRKPVEIPRLRFVCVMPRALTSMRGTLCWSSQCSIPAKRRGSRPGSPRRRRKAAKLPSGSSTSWTSRPEEPECRAS
jgi:hypothetical protein